MKKIDEIRERAEKAVRDAQQAKEYFIRVNLPAQEKRSIACQESIEDIPNLCDALEYVSEALVMVEGPTVGEILANVGEILAKINGILEKGKE